MGETPVDRLIRQGSIEQPVQGWSTLHLLNLKRESSAACVTIISVVLEVPIKKSRQIL